MMSSPVQEYSRMENDNGNGVAKLTKSQKRNRKHALKKKLIANLRLLEKGEDMENPKLSSLQDNPNTGIGETSSGTNATDNTSSKKGKRDSNSDLGDILSTRETESTQQGLGMTKVHGVKSNETASGKIATPDVNMLSKEDNHTEVANGKTADSETTYLNPASKKRKRKKMKNKNSDLGDILSTTKVLEVKSGETVSAKTATADANLVSKGDHLEVADDKAGESEITILNVFGKENTEKKQNSKNKRPTLGEILNPQYLQNLEAAKGEMGSGTTTTDNPASKIQKRQKLNKNSDLDNILSTRESTQDGLSTTKVLEVKSGETVSAKTATADANLVSKGDHLVVADDKAGESEITILNVFGKENTEKKQNSKNKRPTLGEILNPQYLQNLEAAKGEMGSGTTTTDNPASKIQKRQKLNKNSDLDNILSTRESTQDGLSTTKVLEVKSGETVSAKTATPDANMVSKGDHTEVANGKTGESETSTDNPTSKKRKRKKMKYKNSASGDILSTHEITQEGLSATKVFEVKSGESVTAKTATADANMVSKGDHTEVANGKMGESETTDLNVNGKEKKKKKSKLKIKRPTLGEILNPRYLELLEASDGATNSKKSEKRKSQDTIIMNKGSATAESETGDFQEIVNGEKGPSTIADAESTVLKSTVCPQVENSEMGSTTIVLKSAEPAGLEITEANASKELAEKRQNMGIKEITQVVTSGKKLVILDVNGLLADVSAHRPYGIRKPDKYIRERPIFKRPYLDDFMRFCFDRFHVGIWSSRTMKNLDPMIDYLLGHWKKELLFLWDGSKCTKSGIGSIEVDAKTIVVKDLRKIWDADDPDNSWVKGTFHESNTLLLDDSPYKALVNPKHTGIFPASYNYKNWGDNFLGPKGDLQNYLEGLAAADDVKTYVEQHPFGQGAIDEHSPDWPFYSLVLQRLNGSTSNVGILPARRKARQMLGCRDFDSVNSQNTNFSDF
ncbi:hypothetical protein L1987_65965 [Smallanthus sonchifolius]|uniref:Uncharacterized protein n=1 Tax=Smallanthus sonchifolius TaxID=185202 RepID=A0ACB9BW20_9ASTR|nr:hypothetical protein L1987_65965 [Smallanthus sonchifolius]